MKNISGHPVKGITGNGKILTAISDETAYGSLASKSIINPTRRLVLTFFDWTYVFLTNKLN